MSIITPHLNINNEAQHIHEKLDIDKTDGNYTIVHRWITCDHMDMN